MDYQFMYYYYTQTLFINITFKCTEGIDFCRNTQLTKAKYYMPRTKYAVYRTTSHYNLFLLSRSACLQTWFKLKS